MRRRFRLVRVKRAGSSSYFIASHGLPRSAEWIEDEASIELDAEISTMEPIRSGVDNLAELVQIHKADPGLLPRRPKPRE